jgi:hypothetical protein
VKCPEEVRKKRVRQNSIAEWWLSGVEATVEKRNNECRMMNVEV